jgi:2-succinyl-5-enolpyruvyl-6-hydroxy-3-cyclohexene-1-carboxylate synthase
MYSNKKSVQHLVALLKAFGVHDIVISPGARNLPISRTLLAQKDFTCYPVLDERGAGYFAIGISKYPHTARRVAICCTSGTAALNFGPAVAEAFNQRLPIVVITADRPECWVGQLENQTIPQKNIFGPLVKMSVNLPEVNTEEDEWYCNRLINEALIELTRRVPGPVHINVPLSEPLHEMIDDELPYVRVINRVPLEDYAAPREDQHYEYARDFLASGERLLILGEDDYSETMFADDNILLELDKLGCVVLAEHTAKGITAPTVFKNFDAIIASLPEREWGTLSSELVITVGGVISSKRIKQLFRKHKPWHHWHLSLLGEIVDPFQCLNAVIEIRPHEFFEIVLDEAKEAKPSSSDTTSRWRWVAEKVPYPSPKRYSDLMAIGAFMSNIPAWSSVFLGNSMAVRLANLFPPPIYDDILFFANRGVSGIDGNLSTAIAIALQGPLAEYHLTFALIGDLAFYYDMNAVISTGFKGKNLRILLNNNGGGEIFHTLPGYEPSEVSDEFITLRRTASARDWAIERDFIYLSVRNEEELRRYMPVFLDRHVTSSMLLEVFTDMDQNIRELNDYYDQISLMD